MSNTSPTDEWGLALTVISIVLVIVTSAVVGISSITRFIGSNNDTCKEELKNAAKQLDDKIEKEEHKRRTVQDRVTVLETVQTIQHDQIQKMDAKLDKVVDDMHDIKNSITAIASVVVKE